RPYRSAWPKEKTLEYIIDKAGTHFDPELVRRFIEMV
ncbi:MAG TPA: HD-GYP domain-containing protein, partial [Spirochaetaceae bacterium]|nr:HD-GYP domain-containing protein [Spirochaetaceae bacterium]